MCYSNVTKTGYFFKRLFKFITKLKYIAKFFRRKYGKGKMLNNMYSCVTRISTNIQTFKFWKVFFHHITDEKQIIYNNSAKLYLAVPNLHSALQNTVGFLYIIFNKIKYTIHNYFITTVVPQVVFLYKIIELSTFRYFSHYWNISVSKYFTFINLK